LAWRSAALCGVLSELLGHALVARSPADSELYATTLLDTELLLMLDHGRRRHRIFRLAPLRCALPYGANRGSAARAQISQRVVPSAAVAELLRASSRP
jgi:hypothetical protein